MPTLEELRAQRAELESQIKAAEIEEEKRSRVANAEKAIVLYLAWTV